MHSELRGKRRRKNGKNDRLTGLSQHIVISKGHTIDNKTIPRYLHGFLFVCYLMYTDNNVVSFPQIQFYIRNVITFG